MRIKSVSAGMVVIFLVLFCGLLNLEVVQGKKYRELSNKNCVRLLPQTGSRGMILDRQGKIIAGNYLSYNLMVVPQGNKGEDRALARIARVLGTDQKALQDKVSNGYLAPFTPVNIASNIDIRKAIALEELKSEISDVVIQPNPLRNYPYGKLACHVLGYLNEIDHWRLTKLADYGYETKDIVGFGGVEEKYDYYLRQEKGGLSVEVDHRGRFMGVLGFKPPRNGKDIQLTLDLRIQKIIEDCLGARKGSVIVMDPHTGEILGMTSSPGFNPAAFVKKTDLSAANLLDNPDAPLINRAIAGVYPAGSVFKLVVATAALETGKINLSTTFFCPGSTTVGKQKFACWNTHDQQDLIGAIVHSCNVFFYKTGLLVGPASIHDYAVKFGFSKPAAIDLPYEASGFVPSPLWQRIHKFRNWFDGDTANFAIGQGDLLVTPLQVARMMAVFANRGSLITPYIIEGIDGKDVSGSRRKITNLHLKESTIDDIRQGLKEVVSSRTGTASILSDLGVSVAGKTGTAQVSRGQPHGWFAGFFPFKNPKYVICVFTEHGGAGYVSSMMARQIIQMMVEEKLV